MKKEEVAYLVGYRVSECGVVTNPVGYEMKVSSNGNKRYPQFNFKRGGKRFHVRMHRLAAYCFYGVDMFNNGMVVRHLNDIKVDLSKENIALGSQTDNMGDIPESKLKEMSEGKRRFAIENGIRPPLNFKIPDSEVPAILSKLDGGRTHRDVAKEYGVHHSTIGYVHTNRRFSYEENRCS